MTAHRPPAPVSQPVLASSVQTFAMRRKICKNFFEKNERALLFKVAPSDWERYNGLVAEKFDPRGELPYHNEMKELLLKRCKTIVSLRLTCPFAAAKLLETRLQCVDHFQGCASPLSPRPPLITHVVHTYVCICMYVPTYLLPSHANGEKLFPGNFF